MIDYAPSARFENTNGLYGNHFRFAIEALPDLTFYAQSAMIPPVSSGAVMRPNPFAKIAEPGDTLTYGHLDVSYLIDAQFKTYYSLYWWLKGYGFPHSYEEVLAFNAARTRQMANPRPSPVDIQRTNATLLVLQPDTESVIVEIHFIDVFPTQLGEVRFETTDGDAPQLRTTASFAYSTFDVVPVA